MFAVPWEPEPAEEVPHAAASDATRASEHRTNDRTGHRVMASTILECKIGCRIASTTVGKVLDSVSQVDGAGGSA